jgi:carbon-monoxide dehydrogenase small subunit
MPDTTRQWIVNGRQTTVRFDSGARLLDVVRGPLGLTGSKEGCGEGECGACSVVVDGRLTLSCLQLAAALPDGVRVTTVEGVAASAAGARLQHALLQHGGVQCGFCTPGIVVAAWWYLEARPPIDVREALSGNLCRCTGYQGIVTAVREAVLEGAGEGIAP